MTTPKAAPGALHVISGICWKKTAACLCLILAVSFVYAPGFDYGFVRFDDNIYVYENQMVKNGLTPDGVVQAFKFNANLYWHPVTWLSHMFDVEIFGLEPGKHHMVSFLLHLANTLLLLAVLSQMTGCFWKSAMVAALFALHPINVDSVAWIAERKSVLSALFLLLTLQAYIGYVNRRTPVRYLAVVLFFVIGLLSKPTLTTLPFGLLLLDFWPLKRFTIFGVDETDNPENRNSRTNRNLAVVMEKLPLLALSMIAIVISSKAVSQAGIVISMQTVPLSLRIENAVVSYLLYMGKIICPANLSIFYPYPASIPFWQTLSAAVVLAVISIFSTMKWKNHPWLPVGWFWFFGMLVPVSGLMQAGLWPAIADRWAYIPQIGLFVSVVWSLGEVKSRWRIGTGPAAAVGIAALVILATVARLQVGHWRSDLALYKQALSATTDNYWAHNNYGNSLMQENRIEEAIGHYLEAVRIKPDYWQAHANLGQLFKKKGHLAEASDHYRKLLKIKPDSTEGHNNFGVILAEQGDLHGAIIHYRQAIHKDPAYVSAHVNLANAYAQKKMYAAAAKQYSKVISLEPTNYEANINLGMILANQGRINEAINHFDAALDIRPGDKDATARRQPLINLLRKADDAIETIEKSIENGEVGVNARVNLGNFYGLREEWATAAVNYRRALELKPNDVKIINALAIAETLAGNLAGAVAAFRQQIAIEPNHPEPYYNLACVYSRHRMPGEALQWLARAIDMGYANLDQLEFDPDLDNIRNREEFKKMIESIPS